MSTLRLRRFPRCVVTVPLIVLTLVLAARSAGAETTMEKIARTGVLPLGTRTGVVPFAYKTPTNEWVGFAIDLVEQAILPEVSQKLGKPLTLEKKESTPPTRISLLTSNTVDLVAESMTDTRTRRESVDFSLTYFVTGA